MPNYKIVTPVSRTPDLDDIFSKVRINSEDQKKSFDWYMKEAKQVAFGLRPTQALQNKRLTKSVIPGNMYLFLYDPKHKDTLPYYDTVPLVIPFRTVPGGFLGINLHYLPYGARLQILDQLGKLVTNTKITENTKIRLSWQIIENSSKLDPVKTCVKHYLSSQMRSSLLKINYTDWKTAVMLPLQNFRQGKKA